MKEIPAFEKLQNYLLEAFNKLSSKEVSELNSLVNSESLRKGFTYQRHAGNIEAIHLMLVPGFLAAEQVAYLKGLSIAVKRGLSSVYNAWFHDPELEALLPFDEEERLWLRGLHREAAEDACPVWFRLDCHFHMKEKDWRERISIFEINSCAVGGIHYSPVAEEIFLETILPALRKHLPGLPPLKRGPDSRELLLGLISRHASAIGRKTLNIALAEDKTLEEGITEGPYIVDYLKGRGLNAVLVDPRELYVKEEEVYWKDTPVDIVYRNFELRDIIEMEKEGGHTDGIKLAFSKNQVISSLCGEFDHKSMWEALGGGGFDNYYSKEDALLFKKHLLWTRVIRERRTAGPEGFDVDLAPYTLKSRDSLVIKPNRLCGGYGVAIGRTTSQADWEALIETALREDGNWVVQRFGAPEEFTFPLFEDNSLVFDNHNIVYGLSAAPDGTGILGRVSRQNVVNVAQQGGLMPVLRLG